MSEITQEHEITQVHEITQTEALRLADALAAQALTETEAHCRVLAQFIAECDRAGARASASIEAVRELRARQDQRQALIRRRALIQEALECPVGENPAKSPLYPPPPGRSARRTQQQLQIQRRRRLQGRGSTGTAGRPVAYAIDPAPTRFGWMA
jgi:hypothetical protein